MDTSSPKGAGSQESTRTRRNPLLFPPVRPLSYANSVGSCCEKGESSWHSCSRGNKAALNCSAPWFELRRSGKIWKDDLWKILEKALNGSEWEVLVGWRWLRCGGVVLVLSLDNFADSLSLLIVDWKGRNRRVNVVKVRSFRRGENFELKTLQSRLFSALDRAKIDVHEFLKEDERKVRMAEASIGRQRMPTVLHLRVSLLGLS